MRERLVRARSPGSRTDRLLVVPTGVSGWTPLYLLTYEAVYYTRLIDCSGIKRHYLFRRYHTDPVLRPKKPLGVGAFRSLECQLGLVAVMSGRDERVGAVLKHFCIRTLREALGYRVKVAEHCVAPLPAHQEDGFWVHLHH